ncbi:hypothetical protein LOC67_17105 [Stieleria sp. JC731]|uniref:hypothetical protein n=1 Tax=Pirellulaceae TaxID=2691357 RepID=UPI001E51774B|nr:hypothetical protein [Stieleria sp. JC731]MCC9602275.1 hypothetical protein [Stieleria sp. JC731]
MLPSTHQSWLVSGVFGFVVIASGCFRSAPENSADIEAVQELFAAYNAASKATVEMATALQNAPENERNAKSLQVHYAILAPALDEFVAQTNEIDPALEEDLKQWHKIATELNEMFSQLVDSEDYDVLDDERSHLNQLLVSEEALSGRIAEHFVDF